MPPKKNADLPKEKAECILRYGKHNNVVQWAEEMQTEIEAEYGSIGEFLTTNKSYVYPRVDEAELASALPDSDEESEYEDAEDEDEVNQSVGLGPLGSNSLLGGRKPTITDVKRLLPPKRRSL